eukprot:TRINITY_DN73236_c0_g1_i1.p1 TRINITY_DN73236_c0_g1~~TRINITY_DN73236_c0_g1_i1.p1  ORF type:complete len:423 (+),score=64.29 TRINITY_DN73236_c0_g1_i1:80-1348(+)
MGAADNEERQRTYENFSVFSENASQPAVLVLGGTNFMGRALVEDLLERGVRVCVVNRGREHWGTSDPSAGKTARVIADRRDTEDFARRLKGATRRLGRAWDLVADFSAFDGADIRASLAGLGADFRLYAYISSDSVYEVSSWASAKWSPSRGARDGSAGAELCVVEAAGVRPGDEAQRQALNDKDSYGHGKLEAEEVLQKGLPEGCRCVALRLPDVIGPYDGTFRLWAYWHWLRAAEDGAPPPQVQTYKGSAKRARYENGGNGTNEVDPDPPLALVYSRDVARFIVSLLEAPPASQDVPRFDTVNLCCAEQVPLSELLTLLAAASGMECKRPRFLPSKNPKTYLPSVDRPWPLSLQRAKDVYAFKPTPLEDVLKRCARFFSDGCTQFPREARRAAKKLPSDAADMALKAAGLHKLPSSSDSS